MKIRNRAVLGFAAWAGARFLRAWMLSVRYRQEPLGPLLDPNRDLPDQYIYAFWHEYLLMPAVKFGSPRIHVLISQHRDGQFITDVITRLGFSTVRGSAGRKGAVEAVRKMIELARNDHIAITPDGPRGPRRIAQPGIAYLASRTGLPVVPVGIGYGRCRRAGSWDRFALPKLFTRGRLVFGEPITVPPGLDNDALEPHRLQIQESLDGVTSIAETWAESGQFVPPSKPAPLSEVA